MTRLLGLLTLSVVLVAASAIDSSPAGAGVVESLSLTEAVGPCLVNGSVRVDYVAHNNSSEALTIDAVDTNFTLFQLFTPNPVPAGGTSSAAASGQAPNGPLLVSITVTYHGATLQTSTTVRSFTVPQCEPVCTPYPQCVTPTSSTEPSTTIGSSTTRATSSTVSAVTVRPTFTG